MLNYAALLPLSLSLFHIFSIGSRQLFKHKLDVKCSHSASHFPVWGGKFRLIHCWHLIHVMFCAIEFNLSSLLPLFNVHEAFFALCALSHVRVYVWADTAWNIVMEELALPLVARLRAFLSMRKIFIQKFSQVNEAADVQMEFNTKTKSSKENDYILMNSSFLRIFMLVNFGSVCSASCDITIFTALSWRSIEPSIHSLAMAQYTTHDARVIVRCGRKHGEGEQR